MEVDAAHFLGLIVAMWLYGQCFVLTGQRGRLGDPELTRSHDYRHYLLHGCGLSQDRVGTPTSEQDPITCNNQFILGVNCPSR